MRINWRSGFTAPSPGWAALLDGLLEPVAEDRLTASQALQALRGSAVQRDRRQGTQVSEGVGRWGGGKERREQRNGL
jgi:hypothetical protein